MDSLAGVRQEAEERVAVTVYWKRGVVRSVEATAVDLETTTSALSERLVVEALVRRAGAFK